MAFLTNDDLLVLLIEECSEVIKAATKCLRFGYDSDHKTGYGKNDVVLSQEIGDLLGIVDALSLDNEAITDFRQRKIGKAERAKQEFGR